MDLIETVNACVRLQKRVLSLAPNTNLNTAGQSVLNDYNAIASRINGKTYALLDQTAILSPYTVNAPIISLAVRISTDDYDDMRSGIESILDCLAAAIRTEGSRPVRVIERRVVEPVVRQLVEDLKLKSLVSDISIANFAAADTALIQPEVVETENPLLVGIIEQVVVRQPASLNGGNIRAAIGRWSGNKGSVTCVSGMEAEHMFFVELKARTCGVLNIVYLPAPGVIMVPMPQGRNRESVILDVSAEMTADDFIIDFFDDNNIVHTERGVGLFSFPMCTRIRFRVTPWTQQKSQSGLDTPSLATWANGTSPRQPAVSFMFELRRTFTENDYKFVSRCTSKVQYILDTNFPETSFVNRPQIEWNVQEMVTSDTDTVWSRKIAMLVAAFAAKI
uniref:Intermediate capsid protein VP6 n=1 Tax=Bovine group B rotavirus TaxID=35334 RepID=D3VZT3_9REOV|nr:VP6 [Bovine group B rotavirus]ADC53101.1 VP6 [Bovine group B rotavirus]